MPIPHSQRLPFCLVIDPALTMRKFFELTLHRANYPDCATFIDPVEAMLAIGRQTIAVPDIAFVGWRMPRMDGVAVIRLMQERRYHTAVVMLLDQDQDSILVQIKARLAGAQSTLAKPFTTQQLLTHISTMKFTY